MIKDSGSIEHRLALRLLELRCERGWTLTALSTRTGISAPHLSRLEKGERQPSVGALLQLARAYGMSLSQLVEEDREAPYHLIRAQAGAVHEGADGTYTVLSGPYTGLTVVEVLVAEPKSHSITHDGQEWLQVIEGSISLTLGSEDLDLDAGDAIQFDASTPHSLGPSSKERARILLVSAAQTDQLPH